MIIRGKHVTLKLIQYEDIELIRKWRNSENVNKHFAPSRRNHISKKQQENWFHKVSNSGRDFLFLIIVKNEPIGVIEIKNIDWDLREGESGLWIAKEEYQNSLISYEASYLLGEHIYRKLNLLKNKIEVLESNERALRYNKSQGFKEVGKREETIDGEICKMVLLEHTRNDYDKYEKDRERLLKLLGYK